MSLLHEEIMKTNLDLPEGEIKLDGYADPVYADAINVHAKKRKQVEDALKDQNKLRDEFVKETEEKMELSESLFEDYNDAPGTYDKIFNILDNIEHLVSSTMEWSDEEWTINSCEQTADMLEEELKSLRGHIYDLKNPEAAAKYGNSLGEATAVLDKKANTSKRFKGKEYSTDFIYRNKRDPLAEIIQDELTRGETVYRLCDDGKIRPTWAPSLNLDYSNVGAYTDSKGDYVSAYVADESKLEAVVAIGNKYGREVKTGYDKYITGTPYFAKIYLQAGDWDKPYFDPNVKTLDNYK